jgi:hypothetical protein
MSGSGLILNRNEAVSEIKAARESAGPKVPIFVGINNNGLLADGTRIEGQTLLRIFSEEEWERELMVYCKAKLKVKVIEPYKDEITQCVEIPELHDEPLQIRYYGIEVQDGVLAHDHPALEMEPRAPLLPQMLTNTQVAWPFLYVYAEVKPVVVTSVKECSESRAKPGRYEAAQVLAKGLIRDWSSMEATINPTPPRDNTPSVIRAPPSPDQRRRKLPIADVSDDQQPSWAAPSAAGLTVESCAFTAASEHWDTGSPDPTVRPAPTSDARTADRLQIDAQQAAAMGNHKEAYQLMEKAVALACAGNSGPSGSSVPQAHEADYAPMREEAYEPPSGYSSTPKSFKPATTYKLADGKVHVIAPGMYSEDSWFAKTLEAQDMVDAAKRVAERTKEITSTSKYDGPPITRTESQIETIARVDGLTDKLRQVGEHSRDVMEKSMSKEASPVLASAGGPELPAASDLVSLGESLANVKITLQGDQQSKWDTAGSKLAAEAAAIWAPKP